MMTGVLKKTGDLRIQIKRETGVGPATSTLARSRSTTELFPHGEATISYSKFFVKRICVFSFFCAGKNPNEFLLSILFLTIINNMPSQLLHTLFGEDVSAGIFRRLEGRFGTAAAEALETIQRTHKKVFALGCQGPDIFYHSRRRRPVGLEYGTLLHRRGVGRFTAELLALALPQPPAGEMSALAVYALGFMTHAILDRAAHPFIVYKSCRLSPPKQGALSFAQSHAFFERIIDALMFKTLRGADVAAWDQDGLLAQTCASTPNALKELLARGLLLAFPERAGKDGKLASRIENTFLDCAVFYCLTAPVNVARESASVPLHERKSRLVYVYPEKLPQNVDFLNLEKRPWFYPAGRERADTRSFPELYAAAAAKAADSLAGLIGRYLEEGTFPVQEASELIGNGGLSIVDEAGVPCPPCRTGPLPLDEVMDWLVKGAGEWSP